MRPWASLSLFALLAMVPLAAAQGEEFTLAPGTYRAFPVEARDGSQYEVSVTADVAVDVLLVNGTDDAFMAGTGGSEHAFEALNRTSFQASGAFPRAGRWTLIIDNSNAPVGGANGTSNATISARIVFLHRIDVPTTPTLVEETPGSSNPWPVLMLTAPFWDLGLVGLGGMALWFLLIAALAAARYQAGWDKLGVLVVGVTLLVAVWSLLPAPGPVTKIALPLLFAAGTAWLATRATPDGLQRLRLAFLAGGFGALLGIALGHLVAALWSNPGMMIVGADRFDDPVFVLPVAAGAMAFLFSAVAALVEASEDEPTDASPAPVGLGAKFTVTCLRCATPITVDRSMKRYRVATDRYEFACPNCHAWMEWAEPKADGAAAA
ncbi:MAG: hypothetical protein AABY18_08500 [Candidatus Thermoplasmatota archaeon]